MYKLGIDVGGTNTDAVLIDENLNVVADIKCPTTGDIYDGILAALRTVLAQSGVDRSQIKQAMLGTTQCTNAIVERKNLAPIGILRIGAPATLGIPPMVDWAEDISRIAVGSAVIGGGFEYDGKHLAPFDAEAAKKFFLEMKEKGVKSIAISCVFSTVRNDHELEAAALCREVMGEDVHVSISSEIGSMGLIERENATILNAALWKVAERFTEGFAQSLADEGITNADVYLSQNDGTLMTMEHARRYPILTVACGPTNSIRGASYLSSLQNAIVIDVGGTTTDLGVIQNGFPRESSVAVTIGGVRTNFRMPDVVSIGLGGGSIVREHADGSVTVGPDSVGYEITKKALVFGGDEISYELFNRYREAQGFVCVEEEGQHLTVASNHSAYDFLPGGLQVLLLRDVRNGSEHYYRFTNFGQVEYTYCYTSGLGGQAASARLPWARQFLSLIQL